MAQEYSNLCAALASVSATASGALVVPTFAGSSPGFNPTGVGAAHTAVGTYDLVLDDALNGPTQGCLMAIPVLAVDADASCVVLNVSDTVKRVITKVAGVNSDAVPFNIVAFRRPG